jgi:CHASE3 domain sensor protein
MKSLSFRMKLALALAGPLLSLLIAGAVSYSTIQRMSDGFVLVATRLRSIAILRSIDSRVSDQQAALRGFLLDPSRSDELGRYADDSRAIAEEFRTLDPMVVTPKGKEILAQLHETSDSLHTSMDRVIELAKGSGNTKKAAEMLNSPQVVELQKKVHATFNAMIDRAEQLDALSRSGYCRCGDS